MTKLWGGRFDKATNKLVEKFSKSIHFDYKLAKYDVLGSIAHVAVLKRAGYLKSSEAAQLLKGLESILTTIEKGRFVWDPTCEDIHTDIQNKLEKKVGKLVLKLHTARSRNDQVVLATKLYCKSQLAKLERDVDGLIMAFDDVARRNAKIILPGFTHLQHAQPVYLKDYLNAYIQMLARDKKRLRFISENIILSMGSGALAGTPIPSSAYLLKDITIHPTTNSLDVVSDRDFVIEIISALALIATHLSRLSEDLILWATKEFQFIELDDAFCTGSSLMPQKKNPDLLELIRGYSGRLYGNLVAVLTMMKGLPLTYNRDMQLDKEPLFNSFEIISTELEALTGLIRSTHFNEAKINEHLKDESLYATDLVYYLVNKGVAFKEAHTLVGQLVNYSIKNNILIKNIPENILKEKFSAKIVKKELVKLFDPQVSVESKKSIKR